MSMLNTLKYSLFFIKLFLVYYGELRPLLLCFSDFFKIKSRAAALFIPILGKDSKKYYWDYTVCSNKLFHALFITL